MSTPHGSNAKTRQLPTRRSDPPPLRAQRERLRPPSRDAPEPHISECPCIAPVITASDNKQSRPAHMLGAEAALRPAQHPDKVTPAVHYHCASATGTTHHLSNPSLPAANKLPRHNSLAIMAEVETINCPPTYSRPHTRLCVVLHVADSQEPAQGGPYSPH
jgi:hypothetical protein